LFRSNQETLQGKAIQLAELLSGSGDLTTEKAKNILSRVSDQDSTRIVVTDSGLNAVYDNAKSKNVIGKLLILRETLAAVSGNDIYYATFTNSTLISKAASPVISFGRVTGAVYLYEEDRDMALLIHDMQISILELSLVVCLGICVCAYVVIRLLRRRMGVLQEAIGRVRDGEYGHHAIVKGNDEIASIAKAFNQMSDRFEKVEATRRQFVSDASHELKTPLSVIRMLADTIVETDNMSPAVIREFVGDIADEANRLTRLTERLLNISRLEQPEQSKILPVDLKNVAIKAMRMLTPAAEMAKVKLKVNADDNCFIAATEDGCYQILFNLMENAIKYNREDGNVSVFIFVREEKVNLIVADTGVGISEDDVGKIFERFYRVDKARSRAQGGTGLGLAIVQDTVHRFNGNITVESELGVGTRMSITFPLWTGE